MVKIRAAEWVVLIGSVLILVFAIVVGTIIYLKPPPVRFVYIETEQSKHGDLIYRQQFCSSCHEVFANGATYGPNLDGVGSRRTVSWLREYVQAPRPGVGLKPYRLKMPAYDTLQAEELDALAAYLSGLRELDEQQNVMQPSG
jgi:cytochrome c553